jgi:hypothetical protein
MKVIKGEKLRDHVLQKIDSRLADVVSQCRDIESSKRPQFKEIIKVLDQILSKL